MQKEIEHDKEHRIGMMVESGVDEQTARGVALVEVRERKERGEYELY